MVKFSRQNSRAAKLNSEQVMEIRRRFSEGETQVSLGLAYNVSTVQIGRITRGESWRVLPTAEPTLDAIQASEARMLALMRAANPGANAEPAGVSRLEREIEKLEGKETKGDKLLGELLK